MSTLKTANIQDTSGGNNSTPEEIYSGRAKAWVNFDGTGTVAIRASFNVSSITDNGTGDYTVNFTTAFADTSYCCAGLAGNFSSSNRFLAQVKTVAVDSIRIGTIDGNNADIDVGYTSIATFR